MTDKALLELVAEILQTDAASVSLSDDLKDRGWDSLANLEFIAHVDEVAGIVIDADELAEAVTVADLRSLVATSAE